MGDTPGLDAEKGTEFWEKPELRKIDLTDEEVEQLRASDDPMALLLKLKPELSRKGQPTG